MPRCGSNRATRARPLSITAVTPSMVSEVSATLVETMILRRSARGDGRVLLLGRQFAVQRQGGEAAQLAHALDRLDRAADLVGAGHEDEHVAAAVAAARRCAFPAATSQTGCVSKLGVFARYSIRTGNVRPCETRTSQGSRYSRSAPASSVADMTTILRSGRAVRCICSARASVMSP